MQRGPSLGVKRILKMIMNVEGPTYQRVGSLGRQMQGNGRESQECGACFIPCSLPALQLLRK